MKILFIGDIVGKSGRDIVSSLLFDIKQNDNIDLVIANGENSAHGKGITIKIYNQLLSLGIDYITMGNHAYSKNEINDYLEEMDRIVMPINHLKNTNKNNIYKIIKYNDLSICLCNILGSVLIGESNSDPYSAFNNILDITSDKDIDMYFVDLHAETTAEKRLFFEYFKDKARIVLGTHTHVQTADEAIIDNSAFITDVGMCGAYSSIIGRDIDETISANILKDHTKYTVAEGDGIFSAVIIEIDETNKVPVSIERIQIRP